MSDEAQAPAPEAPPVTTEAPAAQPEALAATQQPAATEPETDWKALAAQEKQKREARAQRKADEAQKQRQYEELQAKVARYDALFGNAKADPMAAVEALGITYDDLTQRYIKAIEADPQRPPPEVAALQQKLHELESRYDQLIQAQQTREERKLLQAFDDEITRTLEAKADDFELVKNADEGRDLVREIVAAHYEQTQQILPTEDACRLAEEFLEKSLQRFTATKKLKAKLDPPKPQPEAPAPKTEAPAATLSQDMRQPTHRDVTNVSESEDTENFRALFRRIMAQQNS